MVYVAAMTLFVASASAHALFLGFVPTAKGAESGQTVELRLRIAGLASGLGAFDVSIGFDPAIVSFNGFASNFAYRPNQTELECPRPVDVMGVPTLCGNAFDFGSVGAISFGADSIRLYEVSFAPAADILDQQAVSFDLAILAFTAGNQPGTSPITITGFELADANGQRLVPDFVVSASIIVPEPGAGLLVLLGLAGLAAFRRHERSGHV